MSEHFPVQMPPQTRSQSDYIRDLAQIMAVRKRGPVPMALVHTYGCQQNVADGEKIKGLLSEMGFSFTDKEEEADLILYNTCAVREHAENRVFGNVGALKNVKRRNPSLIIALCGCMMEQEHVSKRIRKSFPFVNLVFGTHVIHRLPELLYTAITDGRRVFERGDESEDQQIVEGLPVRRDGTVKAWLTVMYGCDNFCSYCVVPYVRGRERSRTPEAIFDEFSALVKEGYKDITLLGQNVNSYGKNLKEPVNFSQILRMLDEVEGDYRIRFMTSHPKDATHELIDTIANGKHISHHLHLPFQSGNNRVLREMNRGYTREKYLELVEYAKEKIPDLSLTSDVIVGFPGETYEEFLDTVDLIQKVGFTSLYTFIYSPRVGTRAAKMPDPVPAEEKSKWFAQLCKTQEQIAARRCTAMVGTTQRVLVEDRNPKTGLLAGRTDGNIIVDFQGDESLIGSFQNVRITSARNWVLSGERIK
ncbi:tRNA (N6-isopentenyl adenosine(37)-C2)-methylthiotransferase MiaB [Caproiciproducens galactitolivorans]|uniref:tRNA (N6-isopentenyl adenosine(37)-C2)-methylthiotransferase MiaB n=1 Tax=Caproiciproducens galactitolivorans TaxID=642589 RepID=UPI0024092257|nr:tRNA (N6-isopentenyl adenosine(37)-C2)-methylthiotransferase MiaB [Caproiciproducens galactitolivorans]